MPINADSYKPPKAAERLSSRSITPISTPAPVGYHFTPPPGFPASKEFRKAHKPVKLEPEPEPEPKSSPTRRKQKSPNYDGENLNIKPGGAGMQGDLPQWMKECKYQLFPDPGEPTERVIRPEDLPSYKRRMKLEEEQKRKRKAEPEKDVSMPV